MTTGKEHSPQRRHIPSSSGCAEELRALALLAGRVSRFRDMDAVLDAAISEVMARLMPDAAAIVSYDAGDRTVRVLASRNVPEPLIERFQNRQYDQNDGLLGRVIGDRATLLSVDVGSDERVRNREFIADAGFSSMILAPLVSGETSSGFVVALTRANRTFDQGDANTLSAIGEILGHGIEHVARSSRTESRLAQMTGEKELLASIIRYAREGLLLIDHDGAVLVCSPGAERLTGWPAAEIVGQKCFERLGCPCGKGKNPKCIFDEVLTGKVESAYAEFPFCLKDGKEIWVGVSAGRVESAEMDKPRMVLIARDITDLRVLERGRSELLSTVSHELRTPLTSIRALSELLSEHDFPAEEARMIASSINRESVRLHQIVDNMLQSARLDGGMDLSTPVTFTVSRLLHNTVADFQASEGDGQRFTIKASGRLPRVQADPEQVRLALNNLITNAIKYSPANSPIEIGAAVEENMMRVWVMDQGVGLDPKDQKRVFERFYRVRRESGPSVPGVGLGLHIVKSLVEMQGGSVAVNSAPGKGSTFSFTLPLTSHRHHVVKTDKEEKS